MEELIITKEMRDKINLYLGYELIKRSEVGHHIYDEAPGLGKIGVEGSEIRDVVTNKQLDSNGNIEWYKNPHPQTRPGKIKPFHCKLTTVSARKAKILITSLFPEEAVDKKFLEENNEQILNLRQQFHLVRKEKTRQMVVTDSHKMIMSPNDMPYEGAFYLYSTSENDYDIPRMLFGF